MPGSVPGGEDGAVAQVDDPLPGLDAAAQLGWVGLRGSGQVGLRVGPAALAGAMWT